LSLQSRPSTAWATPPVHFALVILEMGFCKLFAQAGLDLQSSWSQPPKHRITGVSHLWHLASFSFLKSLFVIAKCSIKSVSWIIPLNFHFKDKTNEAQRTSDGPNDRAGEWALDSGIHETMFPYAALANWLRNIFSLFWVPSSLYVLSSRIHLI
jgi:hypothetical protein